MVKTKGSTVKTFNLNKRNSKKFNDIMKNGIAIVAFVMPGCGHCKDLKPTWNQLMRKYRKIRSNMPCSLSTVVTGNESLIDSIDAQGIRGFPTIRVFRNGKKFGRDYESDRSFDSLSNFIDNQFGIVMSGGGRKYKKKLKTLKRKRRKRRRTRKKKRKLLFGLF